ncbi:GIY-YIG nuclease family protein [Bacillus mycoides]|uniref:GIY-YIG nuclease family protein n=1 Tax=Bacillus mycoides TaxID=1405 RepID=UPI001C00D3AC|nr:GIY-YIG nuclease family protein [Bacillus mycoides]QWH09831.1 GIY-YIG nuclease family protein [Bacillus mycoides]
MNKSKYLSVRFDDIPSVIDSLRGVSGLYIFHTHGRIWYIGKAKDFHNRFSSAYLKFGGTPAHINEGIKDILSYEHFYLSTIFVPMPLELIEDKEKEFIHKACPIFNDLHNPRTSFNAIQAMTGEIVNKSSREWSYDEIIEHLREYCNKQISSDWIEQALLGKWRKSYCSRSNKERILGPEKSA